jgi:hypothetical protein
MSLCHWSWGSSTTFSVHFLNGALGSLLSILPMVVRAFRQECLRLCWGWPLCLGCVIQALASFLVFCFGSIFRTCADQVSRLSLMNPAMFLMLSLSCKKLTKLLICDSLLLHFKHCDVHDLADRCMMKSLKFPFAFSSQGPGFHSPDCSVEWQLKAK